MAEYLLSVSLPLTKECYDKLDESNINYLFDEGGEGLTFNSLKDIEKANEIIKLLK